MLKRHRMFHLWSCPVTVYPPSLGCWPLQPLEPNCKWYCFSNPIFFFFPLARKLKYRNFELLSQSCRMVNGRVDWHLLWLPLNLLMFQSYQLAAKHRITSLPKHTLGITSNKPLMLDGACAVFQEFSFLTSFTFLDIIIPFYIWGNWGSEI